MGAGGSDTAIYCNPSSDYTVVTEGAVTTVMGPDGTDTLVNIETLHFADGSQGL